MQTRSQTKNMQVNHTVNVNKPTVVNNSTNINEPTNDRYNIDKHIALLNKQLSDLKRQISDVKQQIEELICTKQESCIHTNKKHIETRNHGYGCYSDIYRCLDCNKRFDI